MSNVIPTVPTTKINLSNDGLKNIAGWIARYVKFKKIDHFGFSDAVVDLIRDGVLTKFEPSLKDYETAPGNEPMYGFNNIKQSFYTFSVNLNLLMEDENYIDLHIVFKNNGICELGIDDNNLSHGTEETILLYSKARQTANFLGLKNTAENELYFDLDIKLSWEEADEVILKFIQMEKKKPQDIPVIPE
jgi:hypothetical protein